MATMRDKWTEERLDDLSHRVDLGFERVEKRFDRLESRLETRLDSMQRTMLQGVIAFSGAMLAGFAAMIALVATQL